MCQNAWNDCPHLHLPEPLLPCFRSPHYSDFLRWFFFWSPKLIAGPNFSELSKFLLEYNPQRPSLRLPRPWKCPQASLLCLPWNPVRTALNSRDLSFLEQSCYSASINTSLQTQWPASSPTAARTKNNTPSPPEKMFLKPVWVGFSVIYHKSVLTQTNS